MKPSAADPATLDPLERASRDEITATQTERLRTILAHAYDHVPHYRAAFETAGIAPGDIRELADLAGLPFTTKNDLRENYPFGMFAVPRERISRLHASSGTTGSRRLWGPPPTTSISGLI